MKRSEALSKILKVLEKWESCKMELRTAKDILDCIENDIEMLPPFSSAFEEEDIVDKWGIPTGEMEFVRVIKPIWDEE